MSKCAVLLTMLLLGASAYNGIQKDSVRHSGIMEDVCLSPSIASGKCLSFCYLKKARETISVRSDLDGYLKYYLEPGGVQGDLLHRYRIGYLNGYIA